GGERQTQQHQHKELTPQRRERGDSPREAVRYPTPEEETDLPAEGWNPQNMTDLELRLVQRRAQVDRRRIEHIRDGTTSQSISADECPQLSVIPSRSSA